jgi:cell division septation protein DedD
LLSPRLAGPPDQQSADRIPVAVVRLHHAYVDAQQAVDEVVRDTGDLSQMRALDGQLAAVTAGSAVALQRLQNKLNQNGFSASAQQAITAAIQQPPVTPDLVKGTPQPTPTTDGPMVTTSTGSPTTTQAPTTTVPTTTQAPTTSQAPTTTQTPTTTVSTTTVPSDLSTSPDQAGNDDSGQGSSGETVTTLP